MIVKFASLTIRWKLMLITMLASVAALTVACGIIATYDIVSSRRALFDEMSLQADMIIASSAGALTFDDDHAATNVLASLTNDSDTRRAVLYTADGTVFAEYRRADAEIDPPARVATPVQRFSRDRLILWRSVLFRGERIGTLYMESDLSELRVRRYAGMLALVMLTSALLALILSSRLQRVISQPIGQLVETANRVSVEHDYSLRVPTHGPDELGVLIQRFNAMLGQIEVRDRALMRAQDDLELRVAERTAELRAEIAEREQAQAELERARDVAESATRAKSIFLANMSHEIRTPINVIIGMTDMALDGELSDEARDGLQTVRRATLGLLAIINDILDCAKIESGKLTLEAVDVSLRVLVADVVELLQLKARENVLTLTYTIAADVPERLRMDPLRVKQVLMNLVANAIKFTEKGGVTIGFQVLDRSASSVRLRGSVRDTGIGIPADRREAIFESFTQADDSTTRNYGGTGLGLTICRELIELMGGRIGVESEPGQGSTFWFEITLPLASPGEERVAGAELAPRARTALRSLA